MGRRKERRQSVGWFSPARRKVLVQILQAVALLTTIATHMHEIIEWFSAGPVKKVASDGLQIKVHDTVVLTGTGTLRLSATGTLV
jgi:hypothetical protein